MSEKEKKNFKQISRRLLSSFRRGRKLHQIKEQCDDPQLTADAGDLEATICLDSPVKQDVATLPEIGLDASKSKSSENQRAFVQHGNVRASFSNLRSVRQDHADFSFSSPRVRRVDLGGPMSASTDSGIDCSILLSERGSPEQFVMLTRREAERIRQENIHSHNESILETLTEVDRSSSEDSENEHVKVDRPHAVDQSFAEGGETSSSTCDNVLQEQINRTKKQINLLSELKTALSEKLTLCEPTDTVSERQNEDHDELLANQPSKENSGNVGDDHVPKTIASSEYDGVQNRENTDGLNNPTVENYFLNLYSNKTDEAKSAEARMRRDNESASLQGNVLQIDSSHEIVNPIPVLSTSVANHRTLPSTPSPARLFVNDNSAFAKCKSIKRSVSDVGKGILGKLRHKRRDIDTSVITRDDSFAAVTKVPNITKKSVKSRLKKMAVKRKLKSSSEDVNKSVHIVDLSLLHLQDSGEKDNGSVTLNQGERKTNERNSPVFKEILPFSSHSGELPMNSAGHAASSAWSPVLKDVLSETDGRKFQVRLEEKSRSPVRRESIHDLTNSICEMTSALCASQRSSAESIACICDCKNRNSDPECCVKRKTPSPYLQTENRTDSDVHFKDENCAENHFIKSSCKTDCTGQIQERNTEDSSRRGSESMLNNVYNHNQIVGYEDDSEDEDDDKSCGEDCNCSDTECSDAECSDLNCSDCCRGSPCGSRERKLSSSSSGSCSESDSGAEKRNKISETLPLNDKLCTEHERFNRRIEPQSLSSLNKSSSFVTPEKCKSPNQNSSFDIENEKSPYSVSFRELDFENGDVMYVEKSFCDNYFRNNLLEEEHESSPYSQYSSHGKTPRSSPMNSSSRSAEMSPTPLNLSLNSSLVNLSPGCLDLSPNCSFTDVSPSPLNLSQNSSLANVSPLSQNSSFINESPTPLNLSQHSSLTNISSESCRTKDKYMNNNLTGRALLNASCDWTNRRHMQQNIRARRSHQEVMNSSYLSESQLERSVSYLNNSRLRRSMSHVNHSPNRSRHNSPSLNRSHSHITSLNASLNRSILSNTSLQEVTPFTPPLDLSMSRKRSPMSQCTLNKPDRWMERHIGQVYSPAKRVLQKNRGLSETDLCRQILDLYVSDAEESGFEPDTSYLDTTISQSPTRDGVGFRVDDSILQYGTYVAPRHTVRETNVDDFSTTTVRKCYTGEARTRRLQGGSSTTVSLKAEDRRLAALEELNQQQNTSLQLEESLQVSCQNSPQADSRRTTYRKDMQPKPAGRSALKDRTNTTRRLSSLEMPPSLTRDLKPASIQEEIQQEKPKVPVLCEKSFDHLTLLHTAHNGQRKVRCLSMNESQSVIKHYPPPREATRISWGQNLSEMDLGRHTPRKTPVKTKPILTQTENNFPYDDDTPSPIVLTKIRKPKSLSKRYKNWPWS